MFSTTKIFITKFMATAIFTLLTTGIFAQSGKNRWQDYFSYSNVSHIMEINGIIYCSAENGFFTYNPNTGELEKNSKINDLNDVGISAFNYSPDTGQLMVGYLSGELDFIGGDENHNMLEIPLHQSYTGNKRVNHIAPAGDVAVISGEFGLATFDLNAYEFLETCYFVQGGTYFGVKESLVYDGVIYAASDNGIFYHPLDEFITNFTAWQQPQGLPTTAFQHIIEFQGKIVASSGDSVYVFNGENWSLFGNYGGLRDIETNGDALTMTFSQAVMNFDENMGNQEYIVFGKQLNTGIKINGIPYGGSIEFGLITENNEIRPDGPYNNQSWSVAVAKNQIWIAPGGMTNFFIQLYNRNGFYHFNGDHWEQHPFEELLEARDVVDIEVNPNDITEYYVSTWYDVVVNTNIHRGIFRYKNDQMVEHYNYENSGLKKGERIGGTAFDEDGNLWISQSFTEDDGKTFMVQKQANGSWRSINLYAAKKDAGARKPFVYKGWGFVALPRQDSGLKITNMETVYTIDASVNKGNLPSAQVISAAIDQNGVLWIGTILGLRVLYNPLETVQQESFQTQPVVIEQNGIPEALLTDIQINDIKVDSTNQKWMATESAGVYCFSDDGTTTVYHFTSGNSPLPSNKVNFIAIDKETGMIYFATDKGLVSFKSDAVESGDSFGDVYAYPNPVRPGFTGEVTIKGLPTEADVRIVDINGNLIYRTKAAGGIVKWDTKNMKGKPVASGIYIALMTNRDATESKQTKIAIVR